MFRKFMVYGKGVIYIVFGDNKVIEKLIMLFVFFFLVNFKLCVFEFCQILIDDKLQLDMQKI